MWSHHVLSLAVRNTFVIKSFIITLCKAGKPTLVSDRFYCSLKMLLQHSHKLSSMIVKLEKLKWPIYSPESSNSVSIPIALVVNKMVVLCSMVTTNKNLQQPRIFHITVFSVVIFYMVFNNQKYWTKQVFSESCGILVCLFVFYHVWRYLVALSISGIFSLNYFHIFFHIYLG